ncbi:MAG: hypothetical protein HYY24_20895 [Verrucomicrobia bacterium]|nr:hypothetical protein [Verrucomicrobiota bacterium]
MKTLTILLGAIFATSLSLLTQAQSQPEKVLGVGVQAPSAEWVPKADLPRDEHANGARDFGMAVLNERIYVVGGLRWPNAIGTTLEYDPVSDKWSKKGDVLQKRYAPAAAVVNGRLYAIGGGDGGAKFATMEEYDPMGNAWTMKASMQQPRYAFAAVTLNGRIYALGGAGPGADPQLATVEEYDPIADKWTRKADMPGARMSIAAAVVGERIYVVGGRNDVGGDVASVYEFNPASNQWSVKATIPTRRASLAAVGSGGKVLTLGGGLSTAFEAYDVSTDAWAKLPDLPTFREQECFAAVIDGTLYVLGGYNNWAMEALRLSPPFCSPHRATATAQVVNGFVVGATITDSGCGYTEAPLVLVQGGGGSGAAATAVVSDGVVVAINITSAGSGYTSTPKIEIASPPFVPTLSIAVSKVKVTQNVVLGRNYVLESSSDMSNWKAVGPQFTATSEAVTDEFDVDVTGRFFRIRQVP